jgi:CHAT domain-containing protein
MDFRGTKLAVLSACKTGLGNDTNLTGLSIGPQHALKTKGVEQIVMSLWMVDDAATTLLMKYFYESLLVGNGAKSALKYAQRKLIEEGYTDPYYWAAFVVLE